jgi:hypothetical protein
MLENTESAIKDGQSRETGNIGYTNGQSRETGNIGYTRRRQTTMCKLKQVA